MRPHRFGIRDFKFLALFFAAFSLIGPSASAFPARLGISPDNNGELLISTILGARTKLYVNIYELESEPITDALIDRIEAGVTLEMLIEGRPLPRVSQESRDLLLRIHQAMKASGNSRNRLYVMMQVPGGPKRRYTYNHAKYVIADAFKVLISSENFKQSGHPVDVAPTVAGNRGWDIELSSRNFASRMLQVFREDSALSAGDVVRYTPQLFPDLGSNDQKSEDDSADEPIRSRATFRHDRPIGTAEVSEAELLTSPHSTESITALLRDATRSVEVEKMSLPYQWKSKDSTTFVSPLVAEMVAAARRGVRVRILMNDENTFPRKDPKERKGNELTLDAIQELADCEKIPLQARIVNVKALNLTYIHNKGMIIDGLKTVVSSINGTQNSVVLNREVAVAVTSTEAARYYGDVFNTDWVASEPSRSSAGRRPGQSPRVACKARILPELQGASLLTEWL